jgi:hypothetical protein
VRKAILLCLFFFTGCSSAIDGATKATTASSNLRAALGADIDLERALLRDTAIKSGQLAFVSMGKYICGDPRDPYNRMATAYEWTKAQRDAANEKWRLKKEKIEETLRAQYAALDVIMKYGDALAATVKGFEDREKTIGKLATAIESYEKYATGEVGLAVRTLKNVLALIQTAQGAAHRAEIVTIALKMEKPLEDAQAAFARSGALKVMTKDETLAFNVWDSCARERIFFLRDFDPRLVPGRAREDKPPPPPYLAMRLAGERSSPTLDFASEYKLYLEEREAFIGKQPDYISLVKAIVDANSAIAHPKPGDEFDAFLDDLAYLEKVASELNKNSETIRLGLKS